MGLFDLFKTKKMNYRGKMKILIRVRRQIAPTVVHHLQSDMYLVKCIVRTVVTD